MHSLSEFVNYKNSSIVQILIFACMVGFYECGAQKYTTFFTCGDGGGGGEKAH